MKRAWRFVLWIVSGITWFHLYIFVTVGCLGVGSLMSALGYPLVRDVLFWTAIIILVAVILFFIAGYFRNLWDEFKEYDERAWNVLKDKKDES